MAGTPQANEQKAKRGTARPHFLRHRLITLCVAVVLIGAGLFFGVKVWIDSRNERRHTEATKTLESGDYRAGYDQLKAVDAAGGTSERSGEQSYAYYLQLARAAYLAGDDEAAKRYAEDGLKRLPPEDSEAYFVAQDAADSLIRLRDGRYRDPYEYQGDKPPVGGREAE